MPVTLTAVKKNPCAFQIELFCRGLRIDDSCTLETDARGLGRTRAGLGSGLELVIPASPRDVWLNAPVEEAFASASPFTLRLREHYEVVDGRDGEVYPVRLPEEPAWYRWRTSSGLEMRRVGVLQGTYLAVYVGRSCAFWQSDGALTCRFCTTGLNVRDAVSVDDVVETARTAKKESGVTFVHLNTGYQRGRALQWMAPHVEAIKRRVGALVGVQAVPEGTHADYDRLLELGCDHFSFCPEFHDPDWFRELCPGKDAVVGQRAFYEALSFCQRRLPKGACSGELIAGCEPFDATLAAINKITDLGAFPTVCIFRPLQGSRMEDWPSPRPEQMQAVMKHVWERCRDRGIPIGLAPNVEVSLIVQPTDGAYLADGNWRDRWYRLKLAVMRALAAPTFRRRMSIRR